MTHLERQWPADERGTLKKKILHMWHWLYASRKLLCLSTTTKFNTSWKTFQSKNTKSEENKQLTNQEICWKNQRSMLLNYGKKFSALLFYWEYKLNAGYRLRMQFLKHQKFHFLNFRSVIPTTSCLNISVQKSETNAKWWVSPTHSWYSANSFGPKLFQTSTARLLSKYIKYLKISNKKEPFFFARLGCPINFSDYLHDWIGISVEQPLGLWIHATKFFCVVCLQLGNDQHWRFIIELGEFVKTLVLESMSHRSHV